jgi:cysteine desulfurase
VEEGFRLWANPSSPHAEGRKARSALEDARERIKAALGWEGELIFTSGASEALAIAFGRAKVERRFALSIEHDAVFRVAPDAELIPVRDGWLSNDDLKLVAADGRRALLAIQHVNSETGITIAPARGLGVFDRVRERGHLVLSDCAQSAGKLALPDCDLAVASAHKFGGPVGIGALLVRDFADLEPEGGHERGYRQGTENLPGALGMAVAIECASRAPIDAAAIARLDEMAHEVRATGGEWLAEFLAPSVPYIRAIAMPRLSGSAQVMRFDMAGISVSQGSACSSGTMKPSRVLKAMGVERDVAERTIRVSLGWNTTSEEVQRFCEVWLEMARTS